MRILIAIVLFVVLAGGAAAQNAGEKKTFKLSDCVEAALSGNPEIKSSSVRIGAASVGVQKENGAYLPSVGVNASYQKNLLPKDQEMFNPSSPTGFSVYTPATNNFSAGATANFTVFDGFRREASIDLAENTLAQSTLGLENVKQNVVVTIYRRFFDLIRKGQIVKIRKENLESGLRELDRIKAQFEAGLIHNGPVYAQEAELGNREFELETAQNDYNLAKSNLLITMGYSPDYDAEFSDTDIPAEVTEAEVKGFKSNFGSLNSAIAGAMENRSEIALNNLSINSAKYGLDIAGASRYPTVNAGLNWNWTQNADAANRTSYFNLSLSYPLFDNYNSKYQIENAKVQIQLAEYDKFITEQNIKNAVKSALLTLESAEKQIEISGRAIRSAKLNYETYKERFAVGSVNITEYLNANTGYVTAQINRINSVYYYLLTQKEAMYAIGKLK